MHVCMSSILTLQYYLCNYRYASDVICTVNATLLALPYTRDAYKLFRYAVICILMQFVYCEFTSPLNNTADAKRLPSAFTAHTDCNKVQTAGL